MLIINFHWFLLYFTLLWQLKVCKKITDNFWTDIINNKMAASIFTLTHIFFNLFLLKNILRNDLDHTFCWLILKFLVSKKLYLISLFWNLFSFVLSCLSFSILPALKRNQHVLVLRYRLVILSRFENTSGYQMKTNFWRNQLQWTLTTTVYNEL